MLWAKLKVWFGSTVGERQPLVGKAHPRSERSSSFVETTDYPTIVIHPIPPKKDAATSAPAESKHEIKLDIDVPVTPSLEKATITTPIPVIQPTPAIEPDEDKPVPKPDIAASFIINERVFLKYLERWQDLNKTPFCVPISDKAFHQEIDNLILQYMDLDSGFHFLATNKAAYEFFTEEYLDASHLSLLWKIKQSEMLDAVRGEIVLRMCEQALDETCPTVTNVLFLFSGLLMGSGAATMIIDFIFFEAVVTDTPVIVGTLGLFMGTMLGLFTHIHSEKMYNATFEDLHKENFMHSFTHSATDQGSVAYITKMLALTPHTAQHSNGEVLNKLETKNTALIGDILKKVVFAGGNHEDSFACEILSTLPCSFYKSERAWHQRVKIPKLQATSTPVPSLNMRKEKTLKITPLSSRIENLQTVSTAVPNLKMKKDKTLSITETTPATSRFDSPFGKRAG